MELDRDESKTARELKSPPGKLVRFFQESRDGWKRKHHEAKAKLIHAEHQVRAVERSRAAWSQRAQAAEAKLKAMRERAAEAESALALARAATGAGKKKSL